MKYLMIGIDGASEELFQRFKMPYVQSLLASGKKLPCKEDLISRGWVEICTGKHALYNGGFYENPKLNSSYEWNMSYNLPKEKSKNSSIQTLWEEINKKGYKVGVMNVPTTNPAPKVNGFFVSGGGGGRALSDEVDESQVYPLDIKNYLDGMGYIVDERVPSLLFVKQLYDPKEFIDRLKLMNERRVQAFIDLSKKYLVDFGFLVFRSVAVVEYLAVGEYLKSSGKNMRLVECICEFYEHLDGLLARLGADLEVSKISLVSDHSLVPERKKINLNYALREIGVQKASKVALVSHLKNMRHILPYSLRQKLKKNKSIAGAYQTSVPFVNKNTQAFTISRIGAIYGVYINDQKRFGGPVAVDDIPSKSIEIAGKLNSLKSFNTLGLVARVVERKNGQYADFFPDVWVDMPEGFKPDTDIKQFCKESKRSEKMLDLKDVTEDNWTGMKGSRPLSTVVNHNESCLNNLSGDLTQFFHLALKELDL